MHRQGYGSALRLFSGRAVIICVIFLSFAQISTAAPAAQRWSFWTQPANAVSLPDSAVFTDFLDRYRGINVEGIATIDYASVTPADAKQLKRFVASYTRLDPRGLAKADQFAYWVNLYNAQIILQILAADIPDSIREIRPGLSGLLAGGPWKKVQFTIADQELSFNDIEHRILRPLWRDARVHFVLNCASLGCPDIPATPLSAANLEQQLELAAKTFINHKRGVAVEQERLVLSSIFDWFGSDFGSEEDERIAFINRYLTVPLKLPSNITYEYDWALNAP